MKPRKFSDVLGDRPTPSGLDVMTTLQHFAIVTYSVSPSVFEDVIPPRFTLDTIQVRGEEKALISVVPFIDLDFTSAVIPFPKVQFGQTNYRVYIIDSETGTRAVWFLGTVLDSWAIVVPRRIWRLPWHPGAISINTEVVGGHYHRYEMVTESDWAPAELSLTEDNVSPGEYDGFPDLQSAMVYLTHPLVGYYFRLDGKLGTYSVWHPKLRVREANCLKASFGLLDRMGIVPYKEQASPYNVLIEPVIEFTIYLPPKVLPDKSLNRR